MSVCYWCGLLILVDEQHCSGPKDKLDRDAWKAYFFGHRYGAVPQPVLCNAAFGGTR